MSQRRDPGMMRPIPSPHPDSRRRRRRPSSSSVVVVVTSRRSVVEVVALGRLVATAVVWLHGAPNLMLVSDRIAGYFMDHRGFATDAYIGELNRRSALSTGYLILSYRILSSLILAYMILSRRPLRRRSCGHHDVAWKTNHPGHGFDWLHQFTCSMNMPTCACELRRNLRHVREVFGIWVICGALTSQLPRLSRRSLLARLTW